MRQVGEETLAENQQRAKYIGNQIGGITQLSFVESLLLSPFDELSPLLPA